MGLIGGLLLVPINGPVRGFRAFLERLRDEAEAVLQDEGRAFAELIDLSMRHQAGELSDADYAEQEMQLLELLDSIRDQQNELPDEPDVYDEDEELLDDETEVDGELRYDEDAAYEQGGELLSAEPNVDDVVDESAYGPDLEEDW